MNLVISDVTTPDMDGFEFCRAMKFAELTQRVPIILLTALASPADIIKGLEAGTSTRGSSKSSRRSTSRRCWRRFSLSGRLEN